MTDMTEQKMRYRLGLDLGTTSLGWAMLRLDKQNAPCAVIKAGVRIFSDGRDPKTGESLAVQRRLARQQRRTRDRKLRRRERLINDLVNLRFFPQQVEQRKALERLDPYVLRAKGLDSALTPSEFGRAVFHLAQRRGFKSNRKTDSRDSESGALKTAISKTKERLQADNCRTIGEWLNKRISLGLGSRARLREILKNKDDGKQVKSKIYDLYLDRSMVRFEFEALWKKQAAFNPTMYSAEAHERLIQTIFHQRDLRPVVPGRCTLIPEEPRAHIALPSQQRFRIYQEVNNLRKFDEDLNPVALTLEERDMLVALLEKKQKVSFDQLKKQIGYSGDFNLEDEKRTELKGNATSSILGKKTLLGDKWFSLTPERQDEIVEQLLENEDEENLIAVLTKELDISSECAERLSEVKLPAGYGSLSRKALDLILPVLVSKVVTYDKAVLEAGFRSHSALTHMEETGELLAELPYYGECLTRHIGFGTNVVTDPPEKRFGKIANPTVHIGLNQLRLVVNALIRRYGRPTEIVIELARDLKASKEAKIRINQQQALNQKRRNRIRSEIAIVLGCEESAVSSRDIEKWILWEELGADAMSRCCPYSGRQISASMLLSDEVEIEHILPFSRTLDDSLNNKTVSMREANRLKGNRTPWEAREDFERQGWSTDAMLARAERMPKAKRYRFGESGYEMWLGDGNDFLARSLIDTQYLSRVAREYLQLICPNTRPIPGRMTAMLRGKFGLNKILGDTGEKNRNDHRHHAVDACVIAVTDQSMLQRFSTASAQARERQLSRLVETMPLPWPAFYEHVNRAVSSIKVSHKPDHGYQGAMHDQTARGFLPDGLTITHNADGKADVQRYTLIPMTCAKANQRHGLNPDGSSRAYKGYIGNSNYCIEICREENGKWSGNTVSRFEAYQIVRTKGERGLTRSTSVNGKPIVMRLMNGDTVKMTVDGVSSLYLVNMINQAGQISFSPIHEANVSTRSRDKNNPFKYVRKNADPLRKAQGCLVTVSPIGHSRIHKK